MTQDEWAADLARALERSPDENFAVDPVVGAQGGRSTRDHPSEEEYERLLVRYEHAKRGQLSAIEALGTVRLACQALAHELREHVDNEVRLNRITRYQEDWLNARAARLEAL